MINGVLQGVPKFMSDWFQLNGQGLWDTLYLSEISLLALLFSIRKLNQPKKQKLSSMKKCIPNTDAFPF